MIDSYMNMIDNQLIMMPSFNIDQFYKYFPWLLKSIYIFYHKNSAPGL